MVGAAMQENAGGPPRDASDAGRGAQPIEERYRSLFTECPVALWEEDITELVAHLEGLKAAGVADLRSHLTRHPEEVARCVGLIRVVAVNRATLRLYGAPDERSLLAGLPGIFAEESLETFREIVIGMAEGRRQFEAEAVNQTLQGAKLQVGLRWSLLPDQAGRPTRVLLSVTDLTARKRDEEALRASEGRWRTLLETSAAWIWETDAAVRHVYTNAFVTRCLGYLPEEFLRLDTLDLIHPDDRSRVEQIVREAVDGRAGWSGQVLRWRHKDGSWREIESSGSPLFDAAGRLVGLCGVDRDVTERNLLEKERIKTQKLESVGALAGGIAHDFNNLLQGVFGYISMARMSLDSRERLLAMLEQAEKALHLSVNLTTQLLTFSKGGKPVRRRIALAPVIEDAARFALSGSRSECRIQVAAGLWQVDADEGQIGQVVQNVVLNADQAMPLGGVVLVSARNLPAAAASRPGLGGGDWVEITVEDQGVGIPSQYLDRIFDPYFTTKEKGSGLGLATSYSIVRNHDGHIFAQEAAGAGTIFTIFLPAVPGAGVESARAVAPPAARPARVLLMDDEELVRKVAGEMLRLLGHDVQFAGQGEEAVEKYRAARDDGRPFDLVILDLTIRGGAGGEETVRRLQEIDPAVTAVVTSGYSDRAMAASFREHGFRAFLKKPFQFEDLSRTVNSLLG